MTVGTLTRSGTAGLNEIRFSGRIGRRALLAGKYRLAATATDAAGNHSQAHRATFTILAAPRVTAKSAEPVR
jgi:hypothetical protein